MVFSSFRVQNFKALLVARPRKKGLGEALRAQQILEFEIGTAIPRHYELDADLKVLKVENL